MVRDILDSKTVRIIIIVIILYVVVTWTIGQPIEWFKSARKSIRSAQTGTASDTAVSTTTGTSYSVIASAEAFRIAMNPSGYSWLMGADGTDEEAIFTEAQKIAGNYNAVWKAYRDRFDSDMTSDLKDELSASDFEKFRRIVGL